MGRKRPTPIVMRDPEAITVPPMSDDTPTRVRVTTKKYHTHKGDAHDCGDVYEVDPADVANLVGQGLVEAPAEPAPPAKPSQPVEPMTAETFGKAPID